MKKMLALMTLVALPGVAFAQLPAHQKMMNAAYKNPTNGQASSAENASNTASATQGTKIGNAISGTGRQDNVPRNQQVGNPIPVNNGDGSSKVCRTIGSTVYYCN